MADTFQKTSGPVTSVDTVKCYPGEPELGVYAAQHGLISIVYYEADYNFATFASGGFGWGGSLTLVCDDSPLDDYALFTEVHLWSPPVITARVPFWINCGHTVPEDADYPPGPPPWTYHIRIDAQVGSRGGPYTSVSYETGPLWIVGGPYSGYPPYHG